MVIETTLNEYSLYVDIGTTSDYEFSCTAGNEKGYISGYWHLGDVRHMAIQFLKRRALQNSWDRAYEFGN